MESNALGKAMEQVETLFFQTFLNRQALADNDENNHNSLEDLKQLSVNEKLQIATALLGDLNHEKSKKQNHLERVIGDLKIQLQVIDMRLVDLEKDAFSFKRDVLVYSSSTSMGHSTNRESNNNSSTLEIKSERILRHLQSRELQFESRKDKLKLQQIEEKKKLQKFEAKLKQIAVSGRGRLDYIDFHKYQNENKNFTEELDQLANELEKIKAVFEKSEKQLISLNKSLKDHTKSRESIDKSIDLRQRHLSRLQEKIVKHKNNINTLQLRVDKQNLMDCTEPNSVSDYQGNTTDVMDIVQQQSKLYELKAQIKTWTRKVEVAEISRLR